MLNAFKWNFMEKDNKVIAAELAAKILEGSFNDVSAKEDRTRIIT